jgi:hypothetical protein
MSIHIQRMSWLVLSSQIIFSTVICPAFDIKDFFPFFKWNLFDSVYKEVTIPMIFIHQADEMKLTPPLNYNDFFTANPQNFEFVIAYDNLRDILKAKNDTPQVQSRKIEQVVRLLFENYSYVKYDVQLVRLNMLDFYRGKRIWTSLNNLGTYEFKK